MKTQYEPICGGQLEGCLRLAREADGRAVRAALGCEHPGIQELAVLLSPAARPFIGRMASRSQALTRSHFGRTIRLYAPLYISDYCSSECVYCGFAANRKRPRRKLTTKELLVEMDSLKRMKFEEILILTGERTPEAGFEYLESAVSLAAGRFHLVTIETFPMSIGEYDMLAQRGCSGVTVYQETYDPDVFKLMHGKGPKSDYRNRLETPSRALSGGLRFAGMGVLLGLAEPIADALRLYHHLEWLRKTFWQAGFSVSFPRVRPQPGGFAPPYPVEDSFLARMIFAFRICLHDTPLVLSTRESERFRDGMAGIGISKMSVASKTAVGGYHEELPQEHGQFAVNDARDVSEFCNALRANGLEPVFKDWDASYRSGHQSLRHDWINEKQT